MKKIRRQDQVEIIAGKDKGKRGQVTKVTKNGRVFVTGLNMVKKHTKPNPNIGRQGGITEQEASLDGSNVAIINPETDKADRVGFSFTEEGKKQRIFKSNRQPVDV